MGLDWVVLLCNNIINVDYSLQNLKGRLSEALLKIKHLLVPVITYIEHELDFSEEETIVTEPITIVLSKAGWIRSAKGHDIDPNTLSYRGDDSLQDFARGRSNQLAVFLDSNGKTLETGNILYANLNLQGRNNDF